MAIGFPPKVTREIVFHSGAEEFLKDSERIFSELGWKTDKREDSQIRAYNTKETEFITVRTMRDKALVESISSGMKYSDGGKNLKNVNEFLEKYGIDTTPPESAFKKYFSPQMVTVLLCLFLLYPIALTIREMINLIQLGGIEILKDEILGYAISWSIHFSAVFLLLKRNKIGWMLGFTFFIFNVVWIGSDFVYSYIQYYDTGLADSNTLFGLYGQMLYKGTGYYLTNITMHSSAAGIMLVRQYQEYFAIHRKNLIIALAIGMISGILFTGMIISSKNF